MLVLVITPAGRFEFCGHATAAAYAAHAISRYGAGAVQIQQS
jgi:predicted PhzF superfamily epimerase YddE/YHI9